MSFLGNFFKGSGNSSDDSKKPSESSHYFRPCRLFTGINGTDEE